jgi:hypothetical protein
MYSRKRGAEKSPHHVNQLLLKMCKETFALVNVYIISLVEPHVSIKQQEGSQSKDS